VPIAEATRRAYLSLLGIEQWLPRASEDELALPAAGAPKAEPPRVAEAAAPVVQAVSKRSEAPANVFVVPPATAARLDELLPNPPVQPAVASATAVAGRPASVQPGAAAAAPEQLGCALLLLPGGLLLVADFARPEAVGLASAESAMYMRLASALAPGHALAMPTEFSWPPAGMRLPGAERPGAAAEALGEMVATQQRRGLKRIAVLGERAAGVLVPVAERLRLPAPVVTVSLAAMLLEPELKRECWVRLSPLKYGAAPGIAPFPCGAWVPRIFLPCCASSVPASACPGRKACCAIA
jgi:hypothetical protein